MGNPGDALDEADDEQEKDLLIQSFPPEPPEERGDLEDLPTGKNFFRFSEGYEGGYSSDVWGASLAFD